LEEARACCGQVDWHPGEPYPGVCFIVTNLGRRAERVVAFYNQRGTAHGRYVTRQMAEVAASRQMFADIPSPISGFGHRPPGMGLVRAQIVRATRGEVSLAGKASPAQHSGAANRPLRANNRRDLRLRRPLSGAILASRLAEIWRKSAQSHFERQ
jgi:hypothetical protein